MSPHAELGLFLFYIGSTMQIKHLCLIFGITPTRCSAVIHHLLRAIPSKLRLHAFAKVVFPNNEKMAEFAAMIEQREPLAHDVIGFMDGVALHSECSSEITQQNSMYNGYHSDTMVNNVIAYGADGKVFLCGVNFPGSTHDGSICSNLLPVIKQKIGSFKICVDQGFPRRGDAEGILVGPLSKRSARSLSPILREYILRLSNCYVSLRQASEWGMRCLQGSFPRIKKRLPSEKKKRNQIIQSIILIHNFRTHCIGCNQIKTVFDDEYERVICLNGNDRISRYYNL
jgi:ribosomal protein S27E